MGRKRHNIPGAEPPIPPRPREYYAERENAFNEGKRIIRDYRPGTKRINHYVEASWDEYTPPYRLPYFIIVLT
jgi:hypothetical protein